jgi:hypothetical protein
LFDENTGDEKFRDSIPPVFEKNCFEEGKKMPKGLSDFIVSEIDVKKSDTMLQKARFLKIYFNRGLFFAGPLPLPLGAVSGKISKN